MQTVSFDNGDELPVIGLGTWKSAPGEVYDAVKHALDTGYRHLDCAPIYGNEAEVGRGLSASIETGVVDREDVWVTSKLWNDAHRPEHVRPALESTLEDLQLETLDLYLMHWPVALTRGTDMPESPDDFVPLDDVPLSETWAAMEELVDEGLARHIGVSNFNVPKLRRLMDAADYAPEMNQVEMHPYLPQRDLLAFAEEHDVPLTAYSPLGSKDRPDGGAATYEGRCGPSTAVRTPKRAFGRNNAPSQIEDVSLHLAPDPRSGRDHGSGVCFCASGSHCSLLLSLSADDQTPCRPTSNR
ncbi:MAG: aldehyde oxidoreductase [Bacteroidetes bacterium QH_2_63_10]|nr:MAG: aldehyde oxidoreductase [Bacteroidetes bacterium QH_2_63_10]